MAEIEITLPTVQYGNVRVRATPEELGVNIAEPGSVGMIAAMYLNLFTQGFKRGSEVNVTLDPETDVSAPQGASRGVAEAQAQRYLDEGLGGVTELPSDEEEDARTGSDYTKAGDAPWDKPAVDAKPKPWETEGAAPTAKPVLDASW